MRYTYPHTCSAYCILLSIIKLLLKSFLLLSLAVTKTKVSLTHNACYCAVVMVFIKLTASFFNVRQT